MNTGSWQSGTMETHMEYTTNETLDSYGQDTMEEVGEELGENGQVRKRKPWERLGPDGRPIKRKPNPARKNRILRKVLQPKNSVMCLNELQPGLKYNCERVATVGNFTVSVEVNGQTFMGYGSSKDHAKQAAAEAALMSFVKPPPPKPTPGEAPKPEDDETPWKTLASFAMYKLFTDWRDNKVGPSPQAFGQAMAQMAGYGMPVPQPQVAPPINEGSFANIAAHLNRTPVIDPSKQVETKVPAEVKPELKPSPVKQIKEAKLNPERQAKQHPVMILHQMCPQVKYTNVETLDATGTKIYRVSTEINGNSFTGEATAVKKAKMILAKAALKSLYGIDNVYGEI